MSNENVEYKKEGGKWFKQDPELSKGVFTQVDDDYGNLLDKLAEREGGEGTLTKLGAPITTPSNPPGGSVVTLPPAGGVTKDFQFLTNSAGIDALYRMDEKVKLARSDPRFTATARDRAGSSKLADLWDLAEKKLMRDARKGISMPAFSMISCPRCGKSLNQLDDNFDPRHPICSECGFDLSRVETVGIVR